MTRLLLASLISISAVSATAAESGLAPRTSSPPSAARAESATLAGMEPGDRACYIELVDAGGKKSQDLASFEVCEKTSLVGKRVQITRKRSNIMALACEGREDCSLSESVNLIVRIRELK
jgi:hypothetical protein